MKKPMSVKKFIKKKNKIIEKYTGITLVPKDQIVNIPAEKLMQGSSSGVCPYCVTYLSNIDDCEECPMSKTGNYCDSDDSTWERVNEELDGFVEDLPEIIKLVDKFNKQFKD